MTTQLRRAVFAGLSAAMLAQAAEAAAPFP